MISYIGGKARIGKWIVPYIPNDIETYVEGFSGMFWVFFNMDLDKYPNLKTVVYNDYNRLNANLFKCSKQYDRLWEELSKYPCQQLGVEDTPPEYENNKFNSELTFLLICFMNKKRRKAHNNQDLVVTNHNRVMSLLLGLLFIQKLS